MPNNLGYLSPYERAQALNLDVSLFRDDRALLDVLRDKGTLPQQNIAGQYQIGGPIGPDDVLGAFKRDPQTNTAVNLAAEVAPGTGNVLAAERLPTMYESFQQANTPIQKALRGAELGMEGLGAIGDAIPAIGAVGAAGAGLVGMMARQSDHLPALAQLARRQRGIIGSTGAKTADLDALEIAQRMKADGVDADNIHATTGWWLDHPDGRPRFEIDDSGAMADFRQAITDEGMELGDARPLDFMLDHKAAYQAYPDTSDIDVRLMRDGDNFAISPSSGKFGEFISAPNNATDDAFMSGSLHELQHAVQSRENMARGGSPQGNWLTGDAATQAEYMRILDDLQTPQPLDDYARNAWGAGEITPEIEKGYAEYMAGHRKFVKELNERGHYHPLAIEAQKTAGTNVYRRLAGEAEARLVQDRMNLTPAERAADPFYKGFDVPLEDQIVRMEDGVAFSRNGEPVGLPMVYRGEGAKQTAGGNFFSPAKEYAEKWGKVGDGDYKLVEYQIQKPFDATNADNIRRVLGEDSVIAKEIDEGRLIVGGFDESIEELADAEIKKIESLGYDSIKMEGFDSPSEYFVFNPHQPLPTDTASRMQRAREAGFEGGYYKGMYPYDWTKETPTSPGPEIETINRQSPFPSFGGSDGDVEGIAGFLTNDPETANRFVGYGEGGAVYPLMYRKGRELVIDAKGGNAGDIQFGDSGAPFRDAVRSGEYDTITIKNTADEGDVTVALDPKNIRSIFAQFDPAKRDSANILAGGVGGMTLSDERRQKVDEHRQRIKAHLEAARK